MQSAWHGMNSWCNDRDDRLESRQLRRVSFTNPFTTRSADDCDTRAGQPSACEAEFRPVAAFSACGTAIVFLNLGPTDYQSLDPDGPCYFLFLVVQQPDWLSQASDTNRAIPVDSRSLAVNKR